MPRRIKIRHRPPSDERALRHITDPGIGKLILVGALLIGAFGGGLWLIVHGLK